MEKSILVGIDLGNDEFFSDSMEELKNLAEACNISVLDSIIQKRDAPTSNYYIGEGKVNELQELINLHDANVVIFNDELSPSHIRNLEQKLEIKIIDRTVLILDIFARRAKTKEAMLQVELAQSEYMLPRVVGMYKSLSRQKSGTGSKGPGEQQLELDRRILRDKISAFKKELKELVKVRRTQRNKRTTSLTKTVALAGYTNAGKSSLMNSIIRLSNNEDKTETYSEGMLFATLETKTRKIILDNQMDFLLTDTVGFIRKLPHNLVEAFKSTLEEITEASLILHVIDVSNPLYEQQIQTVEEVLLEIGVKDIPILYVFNKVDLLETQPVISRDNSIMVSAKQNLNIDKLVSLIDKLLYKIIKVKMLIPYNQGEIYNELKTSSKILETKFLEDGIHIEVELNDYFYQKYRKHIY